VPLIASLGFAMPTKVFGKLCTAFSVKFRRLISLDDKIVGVLTQVMGDLRLRSQQLNMLPLLWTLYLQSSTLFTAARDGLPAAGLTVTPATVLRYFDLVGKAYSNVMRMARCCLTVCFIIIPF